MFTMVGKGYSYPQGLGFTYEPLPAYRNTTSASPSDWLQGKDVPWLGQ